MVHAVLALPLDEPFSRCLSQHWLAFGVSVRLLAEC